MVLRIKEILNQRGITLREFAQISGISQSNLSNYINGNISPTLDTLNKIAHHLDVDVVELLKEFSTERNILSGSSNLLPCNSIIM